MEAFFPKRSVVLNLGDNKKKSLGLYFYCWVIANFIDRNCGTA
jgi:hypothetical protein